MRVALTILAVIFLAVLAWGVVFGLGMVALSAMSASFNLIAALAFGFAILGVLLGFSIVVSRLVWR